MALTKRLERLYFVAGLPRSGSTLLMNILGQNPQVHVTPTSGLIDILVELRNFWDKNVFFRALPRNESRMIERNVMRAAIEGYFAHVERPIVFDKNRGWPRYVEMVEALLGGRQNVKILVPVRDVRDVVASFEKLHRKTSALGRVPQEAANPLTWSTATGRVRTMIEDTQPLGNAYNCIRDAVTRGWRDRMHFIEYDRLTSDPTAALHDVYDFLQLDPFRHDFANVEQLTIEDDFEHGFEQLHTIRPTVAPQPPQWTRVFDSTVLESDVWKQVEKAAQFWRAYTVSATAPTRH